MGNSLLHSYTEFSVCHFAEMLTIKSNLAIKHALETIPYIIRSGEYC